MLLAYIYGKFSINYDIKGANMENWKEHLGNYLTRFVPGTAASSSCLLYGAHKLPPDQTIYCFHGGNHPRKLNKNTLKNIYRIQIQLSTLPLQPGDQI